MTILCLIPPIVDGGIQRRIGAAAAPGGGARCRRGHGSSVSTLPNLTWAVMLMLALTLTFLPICSATRWYSFVCTTGRVEMAIFADNGSVTILPREYDDDEVDVDANVNGDEHEDGDDTDRAEHSSPNSTQTSTIINDPSRHKQRRRLLRRESAQSSVSRSSRRHEFWLLDDLWFHPSLATPALPWLSPVHFPQEQSESSPRFLQGQDEESDSTVDDVVDVDVDASENIDGTSNFNDYDDRLPAGTNTRPPMVTNRDIIRVRRCLCHPNQIDRNYFQTNEAVPEFYLCPATADYCGIPIKDKKGDGVGCFTSSVQDVVARNAWPLILVWYSGLFLICSCTVHGKTTWDYIKGSLWNRQYNQERVHQLLPTREQLQQQRQNQNGTGDGDGTSGNPSSNTTELGLVSPTSNWNWWAWQRFRLEQILVVQSQWIWRQEEHARLADRRQQGLPLPHYQMRTKRYHRPQHENENPEEAQEQERDQSRVDTSARDYGRQLCEQGQRRTESQLYRDDGTDDCQPTSHSTNSTTDIPLTDSDQRTTGQTKSELSYEEQGYQLRVHDVEDVQNDDDDLDSLHEPTCTICFVPFEEGDIVGDLACNHVFHKDCLKSWLPRSNRCPLCSVPIAKRRDDLSSSTTSTTAV